MFITIDDGAVRRDIEAFKESVPAAAVEASRAELEEIGNRLLERVRSLIPDEGGWYDIYKDSIKLIKVTPDHYELTTTISEVVFSKLQASTTLIWVTGDAAAAQLLAQYNPWTIDTLPSLKNGLTCDLLVRPASESETEHFRTLRLADRKEVDGRLESSGMEVYPVDAELPEVNGKVLADVAFLAQRLEHGLGGFPRVAIWSRVDYEGRLLAGDRRVRERGQNVFESRWRR